MTNATMEEVYNARDHTVEQRRVRSTRSTRAGDPPASGDPKGDSRSISSVSLLFQSARGDRYDAPPSDYANYQFDDEATIDSLSDVFGNKNSKYASTQNNTMMVPRASFNHDDDDDDDDTLAGIIGNVANLHDQEIDLEEHEQYEKSAARSPVKEGNKAVSATDHSSNSSASSSTSSLRKKKAKGGVSNKAMCCWIFGFVIVAAIVVVAYFNVYYKNQSNNGISNDSDNSGLTNLRAPTTRSPSSPTQSPTFNPTTTDTPTASSTTFTQHPTAGPTKNYIDPLMEFLQDNQVYFEKDPFSPDFMAVQWLADEAQGRSTYGISSAYGNGLELNDRLIQRFALLTLDYSLNRPDATVLAIKRDRNKIAAASLNTIFSLSDYTTYERTNTVAVKEVDECHWEGIVCASVGSSAGTVEKINFSRSGLTGTIPPEMHLLKNLKILDLSGNKIHGSIPESLYKIYELKELYLYQNRLTGAISNNIANWWNITHLHLSHNELTGSIPLTFSSGDIMRPIQHLNLYSNRLTGSIPDDLRFRKLTFADFGRNQFTGTLPDDIGWRCVELRYLYMDHNKFTGTIPYSYPDVGNGRLEVMAMNHNQLTGYVPGQFYNNKLLEFTVQNNTFTGVDYTACKQSVFDSGEMIEYKADCDICTCDPFCANKCNEATQPPEV